MSQFLCIAMPVNTAHVHGEDAWALHNQDLKSLSIKYNILMHKAAEYFIRHQ